MQIISFNVTSADLNQENIHSSLPVVGDGRSLEDPSVSGQCPRLTLGTGGRMGIGKGGGGQEAGRTFPADHLVAVVL